MTTTTRRPAVRHQLDRNHGRAGGRLVSIIQEPVDTPGNWELFQAVRVEEPDGVCRSVPWTARHEQAMSACRLEPIGGSA